MLNLGVAARDGLELQPLETSTEGHCHPDKESRIAASSDAHDGIGPEPHTAPTGHADAPSAPLTEAPQRAKREAQPLARHPNKQRKGDGKGKKRGRQANSLVGAMARLLIQHEDALNALHLELEFMIFAQMGHGSVIPSMVKVSEEWHKRTEGNMQASTPPLRMIMATCLFKKLLDTSKQVIAQTPAGELLRKELMTAKIISEDGKSWHQMAWSQEKLQLLPTDGQRLSILQAHETIQQGRQHGCPLEVGHWPQGTQGQSDVHLDPEPLRKRGNTAPSPEDQMANMRRSPLAVRVSQMAEEAEA